MPSSCHRRYLCPSVETWHQVDDILVGRAHGNKSAVQRLLSSLKEKGYIESRDNEGGWRVLITPSL